MPEKSEMFIFSGLALSRLSNNSEKLTRFKIAADTLMTFAGEFFFEEIESLRVAIMLFKLKSILYPPDVTAINTDLAPFWLLHVNIYLFPIIFQGLWVFGREPRSKRTCYLNVLLLTAKTIYIHLFYSHNLYFWGIQSRKKLA